jgi:hypothetical protein
MNLPTQTPTPPQYPVPFHYLILGTELPKQNAK